MSEVNYTSKGQGNLNTVLGAIGTAGGIPEILGGLFGGGMMRGNCASSGHDHYVDRYEAAQQARIAELETEVKLRDANIYTDGKMMELYKYFDGELKGVNQQLCAQAVVNAQITANISCMQGQIGTLMGLTKTIVPIGNICPSPMPEFNSWTAPTAATAG